MSAFVLFRYYSKMVTFRYVYEIKMNKELRDNIMEYGKHILYIPSKNCDIIEVFLRKPNIKKIELEQSFESSSDDDTYEPDENSKSSEWSDEDDEDYDNVDDFKIELINEIEYFASKKIRLMTINPNHWNCKSKRVCGCGCDRIHTGMIDYCNPYPLNAYVF